MMTAEQYRTASIALRNQWASRCENVKTQEELLDLCEEYIADLDHLIRDSGGHPEPPPPRIRP